MIVKGTKISLTRGDSAYISVSCTANGEPRPFVDGETVYFTVKKSIYTEEILIQKIITTFDNGEALIKLDPSDTAGLDFVDYVYDVQVNLIDGTVATIVKPSTFSVTGEVTYD